VVNDTTTATPKQSKRRPGRPRMFKGNAPIVGVKMDLDLREAIDRYVKNKRTDISSFVRGLIVDKLNKEGYLEVK